MSLLLRVTIDINMNSKLAGTTMSKIYFEVVAALKRACLFSTFLTLYPARRAGLPVVFELMYGLRDASLPFIFIFIVTLNILHTMQSFKPHLVYYWIVT